MQMRKNTNIDYIIGTYLKDKDTINPFTQKSYLKLKELKICIVLFRIMFTIWSLIIMKK